MTHVRTGLLKVLEFRRQERLRRQVDVAAGEAELARRVERAAATQGRLRDGANAFGESTDNAAALRAGGRHAGYLRERLAHEQSKAAAAVRVLQLARERLTAAAQEQAAIERLLARHRGEREAQEARAERRIHDESAAHARRAASRDGADGGPTGA